MTQFRNCLNKTGFKTPPIGGLNQFDQFLFHSPTSEKGGQDRFRRNLAPAYQLSAGGGCTQSDYGRTLTCGVTKSPTACPSQDCMGSLARTRTVPARLPKLFRYRLYECHTCGKTIETAEVVTSSDYTKRYVARIEAHRGQRKERVDEEPEDLGLNSW